MHIETAGRGPDLVLLHGWAMHAGIFAPLLPSLTQHYTVHAVDLPGHGRSPEREGRLELASAAARIVARVPNAIWLGWSLGGLVCLRAALNHPAHVRALALVATSPRFIAGPDWPHGVASSVFEQFGAELGTHYRRTIERFLALECLGSDCARLELRELRAHVFEYGEPGHHVLADGLALLAGTDVRAELPRLNQPSLWLAGARDRLIPWQAMQWAAAQQPQAHFACIDGGGHAPFIGHPDRVLDTLLPFLDAASS
jgi:pimeloyl-[acyl-carrier protein] methyl ester esterase